VQEFGQALFEPCCRRSAQPLRCQPHAGRPAGARGCASSCASSRPSWPPCPGSTCTTRARTDTCACRLPRHRPLPGAAPAGAAFDSTATAARSWYGRPARAGCQSWTSRAKRRAWSGALQSLASGGLVHLTWLEGGAWRDLQRLLRSGPGTSSTSSATAPLTRIPTKASLPWWARTAGQHPPGRHKAGSPAGRPPPLRLAIAQRLPGGAGQPAGHLLQHGRYPGAAWPAALYWPCNYPITDRAAIEFSQAFYESLADGWRVDASVAEARRRSAWRSRTAWNGARRCCTCAPRMEVLFSLQPSAVADSRWLSVFS